MSAEIRRLVTSLEKAIRFAYQGSAEHGAFVPGHGEFTPNPFLTLQALKALLPALPSETVGPIGAPMAVVTAQDADGHPVRAYAVADLALPPDDPPAKELLALIHRVVTGDGAQLENLDITDGEWECLCEDMGEDREHFSITVRLDDWLGMVRAVRALPANPAALPPDDPPLSLHDIHVLALAVPIAEFDAFWKAKVWRRLPAGPAAPPIDPSGVNASERPR